METNRITKLAQFTIKNAGYIDSFVAGMRAGVQPDALGKMIASGAITLGGIGVAKLIADILQQRGMSIQKQGYFEKMLEAHPQLNKIPPEQLAKYWESLFRFAPALASDPLAAGAFITQAYTRTSGVEFGGPPPDTYATLVDIQKKYKEGQPGTGYLDYFRTMKETFTPRYTDPQPTVITKTPRLTKQNIDSIAKNVVQNTKFTKKQTDMWARSTMALAKKMEQKARKTNS